MITDGFEELTDTLFAQLSAASDVKLNCTVPVQAVPIPKVTRLESATLKFAFEISPRERVITRNETLAVVLPALFDEVMVNEVMGSEATGDPLMTQLAESIDSPDGKLGDAVQTVTDAPRSSRVVGATVITLPTTPMVPVEPTKLRNGAEGDTARSIGALVAPTKFVAVIVYDVCATTDVGVPLITQVVLLIVSPEGRAGEVVQELIAAPWLLSVVGATDIATPTLPEAPVASAKLIIGAEAPTDKVTLPVPDPAELVPVTVNDVEASVTVGTPLITQVNGLIVRPAGSAGDTTQPVIAAPLASSIDGVTDIATPTFPVVPVEDA